MSLRKVEIAYAVLLCREVLFCFVVFIDQPTIPLGGESFLPYSKLLTLTRFVIRRAPLTVLTVGAALAHAQTFSPWERGVAVIRALSTLAGVKLGCIFSISSHEVVPSCHRTGDISYQVCNGSKLRADGREEVQSESHLFGICCHHRPIPIEWEARYGKSHTSKGLL